MCLYTWIHIDSRVCERVCVFKKELRGNYVEISWRNSFCCVFIRLSELALLYILMHVFTKTFTSFMALYMPVNMSLLIYDGFLFFLFTYIWWFPLRGRLICCFLIDIPKNSHILFPVSSAVQSDASFRFKSSREPDRPAKLFASGMRQCRESYLCLLLFWVDSHCRHCLQDYMVSVPRGVFLHGTNTSPLPALTIFMVTVTLNVLGSGTLASGRESRKPSLWRTRHVR